jgi:hypothetical protein
MTSDEAASNVSTYWCWMVGAITRVTMNNRNRLVHFLQKWIITFRKKDSKYMKS